MTILVFQQRANRIPVADQAMSRTVLPTHVLFLSMQLQYEIVETHFARLDTKQSF